MRAKEQSAPSLETLAVWGLYLVFYLVVFGALTIGAYATVQRFVLGG